MPQHDIIDNRNQKLLDHILRILPSSERAKFAVRYFFLSGFEPLRKQLNDLGEKLSPFFRAMNNFTAG